MLAVGWVVTASLFAAPITEVSVPKLVVPFVTPGRADAVPPPFRVMSPVAVVVVVGCTRIGVTPPTVMLSVVACAPTV